MISLIDAVLRAKFNCIQFPYKLNFALTFKCNSRCKTCNIWAKKHPPEMNLQEIYSFFVKNKFLWINLTGGEIFLRKDLERVLKIILQTQKKLVLFNFTSNCSLPEEMYRVLKPFSDKFKGKIKATFSVDSYNERNDLIRGMPNGWENTLKAYGLLNRIKNISIFFGTTLSKYNLSDVKLIYPMLKERIPKLRFNQMHLNIAGNSPHYYGVSNQDNYENYENIINFYLKNRCKSLNPVHFVGTRFLAYSKRFIQTKEYPLRICSAITESIYIDPYGSVYPCISFDHKLGNLKETNFELKKILRKQKKSRIFSRCPKCWTSCEAYCSIMREFPL